jgi:lipopolysaccharide export system permease protein
MGEVLRAFLLAVLTMTIVFVLFMVMAEAAKLGLSPRDIATLVPFVIPSTLPYTVPVSMLFSVTVVFGRLASDNEVIAVKTAGLSAWSILWPALIMGFALSTGLYYLSHGPIPIANHKAKLTIFKNFEDAFYKALKLEREFNNAGWPFLIMVQDVDVENRIMFNAIFKHRAAKGAGTETFDLVVQAKRARIKFDLDKGEAHIFLEDSEISNGGKSDDVMIIDGREIVMPIPDKTNTSYEKRIQEWTSGELTKEQVDFRRKIARERKRQAIDAALCIGSGRLQWVRWNDVQTSFVDYGYWTRRVSEYETEKQLRSAQAFGTLFFVLLGAPVGILFARRDFLSAFISCFMPIIGAYYPLMLLGVNLGKEDVLDPVGALWAGNVLLGVLSVFTLRPVLRH